MRTTRMLRRGPSPRLRLRSRLAVVAPCRALVGSHRHEWQSLVLRMPRDPGACARLLRRADPAHPRRAPAHTRFDRCAPSSARAAACPRSRLRLSGTGASESYKDGGRDEAEETWTVVKK